MIACRHSEYYEEVRVSLESSCVEVKRRTNYMKEEETQKEMKKKLCDYEMACLKHICYCAQSR